MNCENKFGKGIFVLMILIILLSSSIYGQNTISANSDKENSLTSNTGSEDTSSSSTDNTRSNDEDEQSDESTNVRDETEEEEDDDRNGLSYVKEDNNIVTGREEKEINETELREIIKNRLRLKAQTVVKERVINRLKEIRDNNPRRFDRVIAIAVNAQEDNSKTILTEELSSMDPVFIEKFERQVNNKKQVREVKKQLEEYVSAVNNKKVEKVNVNPVQISKLYSKEISVDTLIEEIWKS